MNSRQREGVRARQNYNYSSSNSSKSSKERAKQMRAHHGSYAPGETKGAQKFYI